MVHIYTLYIQIVLCFITIFLLLLLLILKVNENKKLKQKLLENRLRNVNIECFGLEKTQEIKPSKKTPYLNPNENINTLETNNDFFINKIAETQFDYEDHNQTVNNKVEQLDKTAEISNFQSNETNTSFLNVSGLAKTMRKTDNSSKRKYSDEVGQILVSLDQKNTANLGEKNVGQKAMINNISRSHENDNLTNSSKKFSPISTFEQTSTKHNTQNILKETQNVPKAIPSPNKHNNLLNKLQSMENYVSPRGMITSNVSEENFYELKDIKFDGGNSASNSNRHNNHVNTLRSNDLYRLEFSKNKV